MQQPHNTRVVTFMLYYALDMYESVNISICIVAKWKGGLQDEKLMEGGNLDPRLKIAVEIRAGEKKVLQHIDGIFEERERELDEFEYYQERRLRDLGLVGEQGEIIFWEPK